MVWARMEESKDMPAAETLVKQRLDIPVYSFFRFYLLPNSI
jgi:hypothetical protein